MNAIAIAIAAAVVVIVAWLLRPRRRPPGRGPAASPQRYAFMLALAFLACELAGCKSLPPIPPIPWPPAPTNAPPVPGPEPVPAPEPAPTPTGNTSQIYGVGLPSQRLAVTVACWEQAPRSAKYSIEGEREQPDGSLPWFDVPCTWDHTDVDGACAWAFISKEGILFADHHAGWNARLHGDDTAGHPISWDFTIHPGRPALPATYRPPTTLRLGQATTSPSNGWYAATTGFATYRDREGADWATYAQVVCWQHDIRLGWLVLPIAINCGAVVPANNADRVTPELSLTSHWPPNQNWSLEAGGYVPIGRSWTVNYPECIGAMLGFRYATGLP